MFDRNQPFNDLPALPPAAEVETAAVLKAIFLSVTILIFALMTWYLILTPEERILVQAYREPTAKTYENGHSVSVT